MLRPNPIELLLDAQAEHGHLDDDTLRRIARDHGTPLYELQGLVTFYPHFRKTKTADVVVSVCRDLSCKMRGGEALLERVRRAAEEGSGDVDVHDVSCLGRCDGAPACLIGDEPATPNEVADALGMASDALAEFAPSAVSTPEAPKYRSDPHADSKNHYGVLRDALAAGDFEALLDRIEAGGLRGMGGAGFPTASKWRVVAEAAGGPKVAICNADESEPGTFKDREILSRLPHLVVEGLAIGGLCVGAERGIVFVRHEYAPETRKLRVELERARTLGALGDDVFGSGRRFDVEIFVSPGGYILGEETALLECLEGRRGEPRNKPPFPGEVGLHGAPTLINNVETLCAVPRIATGAAADLKFFSVSGDVEHPGVHEVPLGTPLSSLIELCGGMRGGSPLLAFLPGGASTGFLGAEHVGLPLDWDSLRGVGSALGSGAVVVMSEGADLRVLAGNLTAFFRNESCGKCVPCRIGTERAVKLIEASGPLDVERLQSLASLLADTSICGLGQAALNPISSVIAGFGDGEGAS